LLNINKMFISNINWSPLDYSYSVDYLREMQELVSSSGILLNSQSQMLKC
jgi:hypothetical protein